MYSEKNSMIVNCYEMNRRTLQRQAGDGVAADFTDIVAFMPKLAK